MVLPIFAAVTYSRIIMSLNLLSDRVSIKVLTIILIALTLASCGIGKSTLPSKNRSNIQDEVLSYSKKYIGKPYRYSGKGPNSFDCSGFTSFVFKNFGYKLNSSSSGQDRQFPTVAKKENLAIGDLVFFEGRSRNGQVGHVGIVTKIYPNNEFKFIHSSTTSGVIISSSTEPYYSSRYLRGGRVIEENKLYGKSERKTETISAEPKPPSPSVIIIQNNSPKTLTYSEYSADKIESGSDCKPAYIYTNSNKEKDNNKNSSHGDGSVVFNSDIILRDDTIAIPPPINIHTVERGETLYSISKQYGCTVEDIIAWNPQLGTILKVGDKLQITNQ